MSLNFKANTPRELIFEHVAEYLHLKNLKINKYDNTRPWGGYFVIEEAEADKFIDLYFSGFTNEDLNISGKLSPKILIVAPEKRLSWQYHNRRAEIWKLIGGTMAVVTSDTDDQKESTTLHVGDIIHLQQGKRHRLVGLESWGIVAEIWQHTDAANPSDEEDIVRVQDDFGR
jgi:mannose-6-phosphate isomerase-like protein (cupin superfamily)